MVWYPEMTNSKYFWDYFLTSKTAAHKTLKRFLTEMRMVGNVKVIRTDGGKKFRGDLCVGWI